MIELRGNTHTFASEHLLGTPIIIEKGIRANVQLETSKDMVVDGYGLIHGGFTFGLADYAAMLAVNDPNVVLGSAEVKFIAPVKLGDVMLAEARVIGQEGKKRAVQLVVLVGKKIVFSGLFNCYILDKHVLE